MPNGAASTFSTLAAVIALAMPVGAQSVISTRSGVVHFFEGSVYLGDQPLESHLGKFPSLAQGATLRTEAGRAEILLTPGVFLRMGERSAVLMVANGLADTQVELQTGSVILDSGEPNPDTSVTLIYKDWRVHLLQQGIYRIDSDPPRLRVRQGQAEVSAGENGLPVLAEAGMTMPFAGVLVPEPANELSSDALSNWADGRNESISADNAITAQIDEDPASRAAGLDSFTYFPLLGVPSLGMGSSGLYGSIYSYQPGFNSIYLPGYTYRPFIIGLVGPAYGYRIYQPGSPRPIGAARGIGTYVPAPRPIVAPRPASPRPAAAAPHIPGRVGGHR
jgi:hypothetical protein